MSRNFRPISPDLDDAALEAEAEKRYAPSAPKEGTTAAEERWLIGYEEIAEWVAKHGRVPEDREGAEIFERLLAVGLNQLRSSEAALPADPSSIRVLRHVSAPDLRREPDHIAQREPCADFALYKGLFTQVEQDLAMGAKLAKPLASDLSVALGDVFILGGQLAYVAHVGEEFLEPDGRPNARLLVVYSNGTQSNLLRRSLQKPLSMDPSSRRVKAAHDDPLFEYANAQNAAASEREEAGGDEIKRAESAVLKNGTLYVLRSLSAHPFVAEHREFLHKIGVTGGDVKRRLAKAEESPTFLFAPVEVVASYGLAGISRHKVETLVHQFLAEAWVVISITDRFGKPVEAKEWFHVPLPVIDEVVARIKDRTITDYIYDAKTVRLVRVD